MGVVVNSWQTTFDWLLYQNSTLHVAFHSPASLRIRDIRILFLVRFYLLCDFRLSTSSSCAVCNSSRYLFYLFCFFIISQNSHFSSILPNNFSFFLLYLLHHEITNISRSSIKSIKFSSYYTYRFSVNIWPFSILFFFYV